MIFFLFSKKEKLKNAGMVFIGFAVLMSGMETMSGAVKPLAEVPEFTGILTAFSNPALGVLAGMVLTAVIQSSSASVGILQALCATGAVSYGAAVPIIMGQNIGTCVTAMISGIGASRNAKRAALIHLYFNLIGTVVFTGRISLRAPPAPAQKKKALKGAARNHCSRSPPGSGSRTSPSFPHLPP